MMAEEASAAAASTPSSSTTNNKGRRYHVILTGASGYLGQHLLHSFMTRSLDGDDGDENEYSSCFHIHALYGGNTPGFVKAVQRHHIAHQTSGKRSCVVQVEALDLTDANAVQEWMATKDSTCFSNNDNDNTTIVCIHTAALSNPRACQQDAERAHALNVPKAFFDACQSRGCAMICLSTDQVYDGTCPPYIEEHTEETTTSRRPVNVYGATKLAMEEYVLQNNKNNSSNAAAAAVAVLRSSIILGRKAPILPEHAHDTFLHFCASRQGMDTDFYTDERRTVVSVDDVIATIQWFVRDYYCLQKQPNNNTTVAELSSSAKQENARMMATTGIFNMGGPISVSRFDMALAVFEHLGYDTVHLIAKEKRLLIQEQQEQVPSPLDISMDSKKMESVSGRAFESIASIVKKTFYV
jgi:dTDP-4-dehydrorhamnose reductase